MRVLPGRAPLRGQCAVVQKRDGQGNLERLRHRSIGLLPTIFVEPSFMSSHPATKTKTRKEPGFQFWRKGWDCAYPSLEGTRARQLPLSKIAPAILSNPRSWALIPPPK
jgi:hypothetical protein